MELWEECSSEPISGQDRQLLWSLYCGLSRQLFIGYEDQIQSMKWVRLRCSLIITCTCFVEVILNLKMIWDQLKLISMTIETDTSDSLVSLLEAPPICMSTLNVLFSWPESAGGGYWISRNIPSFPDTHQNMWTPQQQRTIEELLRPIQRVRFRQLFVQLLPQLW